MFGITDLWTYLIGTVLIILMPGPNSLFALTTAATSGRKAGFAAAAGIVTGDLVLMTSAALGVASIMKANPMAFDVVRYAGAGYLAWMGIKALFSIGNGKQAIPKAKSVHHAYRTSLGISLINVKAILFFMAFFPQFVNPSYPHIAYTFAALGLIVQCVSISYLSILILAGSSLARRLSGIHWLKTILNKLIGLLFISFGVRLAMN